MTAADYLAAGLGSWLLASVVVATRLGPLLKRNQTPPETPPAPQPRRPAESSWLDLVPSDCLVDDDPLLHQRFWNLVDSESRWFA